MANVIHLSDSTFKSEVLEAQEPVLVDFWAPWCGPCKMIGPVIEEISAEYEGKAKICKLNVDESKTIADDYGVMSIPTTIIFKAGREVNRLVGIVPKTSITNVLEENL